jgi:hypothetical protein
MFDKSLYAPLRIGGHEILLLEDILELTIEIIDKARIGRSLQHDPGLLSLTDASAAGGFHPIQKFVFFLIQSNFESPLALVFETSASDGRKIEMSIHNLEMQAA